MSLAFPFDIPFAALLGLRLQSLSDGQCVLTCELPPTFCNSHGVAHGGLCMTLLDVAMSLACLMAPSNTRRARCSTVEMKTSFMRPGQGALRAQAQVLQAGSRLAFCEAWLTGPDGVRLAHATGTFAFMKTASPPGASPSLISPPTHPSQGS